VLKEIERTVYRHVQLITCTRAGMPMYMAREGVEPHKVAIVFRNWGGHPSHPPAARETAYRRSGLEGKVRRPPRGMLGFAQDVDTIVEAGRS